MNVSKSTKTVHSDPMKRRRSLSLVMLLVFMMTLFAGIVVTSGCGEEEKTTIKTYFASEKGKAQMEKDFAELKSSGFFSDCKWSTPSDNLLVYEYTLAPEYEMDAETVEKNIDNTVKPEIQKIIKDNIDKGVEPYSVTIKYYSNDGSLITERTITKDN